MRRRKVAAETLMYDIDSICAGKNYGDVVRRRMWRSETDQWSILIGAEGSKESSMSARGYLNFNLDGKAVTV